jgi:hypothetical protein
MMASQHRAACALIVGAVIVSLGLTVQAQRGQRGQRDNERFQTGGQIEGNVPYDGRFTFVRLMYRGFGRGGSSWAHDYPRGERHFMKIVNAVSLVNPYTDASNVMTLDDPELFKFPIAYMAEAGFWTMSEAELAGLKTSGHALPRPRRRRISAIPLNGCKARMSTAAGRPSASVTVFTR